MGDFGRAKQMTKNEEGKHQYVIEANEILSVRGMSPNIIRNNICDEQSDIWSYGCLCVEIVLFGSVPYPKKHMITDVYEFLTKPNNTMNTFFTQIFGTSKYKNKQLWSHFNAILTVCFPMNGNSSTTFTKLADVVNSVYTPGIDL